jgi:hypothetical protein
MTKNTITIEIGKANDATVYALNKGNYFTALLKEDLEYVDPDVIIKCDSGAYPGVSNFEQYICNEAFEVYNG